MMGRQLLPHQLRRGQVLLARLGRVPFDNHAATINVERQQPSRDKLTVPRVVAASQCPIWEDKRIGTKSLLPSCE